MCITKNRHFLIFYIYNKMKGVKYESRQKVQIKQKRKSLSRGLKLSREIQNIKEVLYGKENRVSSI